MRPGFLDIDIVRDYVAPQTARIPTEFAGSAVDGSVTEVAIASGLLSAEGTRSHVSICSIVDSPKTMTHTAVLVCSGGQCRRFAHPNLRHGSTALLLHGQFGSGAMWREVAPRIADAGYRVVAVDLPGHGESPPNHAATLNSCVEQIVDACPAAELAIGHSLGSLLLAHCVHRVGVQRAIYVDSPFAYEMRVPGEEYRRRVAEMKELRTLEWLRKHRPHWDDEDRVVESLAAEQFDVETSLSLMTSISGVDHRPRPGAQALIVVPRSSEYFEPGDLTELRDEGFAVEEIDGAGHTVWYGHVDGFMSAISSML